MISVAAELAEMHPQTLRMYEARGLIEPKRSPKGTRLYSQADVERLRRIQEMTTELGLNLAGVERVLELEEQLERATPAPRGARAPPAEMRAEMEAEIERVRKSFRAELVPYKGTTTDLIRADDVRPRRAVDPRRARHVASRRPRCVALRDAYCITEGKRTRAARPFAVVLGGSELAVTGSSRVATSSSADEAASDVPTLVRPVRAPGTVSGAGTPSLGDAVSAAQRRRHRGNRAQVLPRVVPPSPPASSSAA